MAGSASTPTSQRRLGHGDLILAALHGLPVTAYDALSGDVVAEFPPANTPRHGLAVAAGAGGAAAFAVVAASHVCPRTGAGSIRLLRWSAPTTTARTLRVGEPIAPLVATPCGSHLLAGGVSGLIHVLALPSGDAYRSFHAHGPGAVSCLALNDDGSLLVSGGEGGEVAVFPLLRVLDVDAANNHDGDDLALYRIAAHVAPVTYVACSHGGCNAVVSSASMDGTCKVWSMADGTHLRTLTLPGTALSLAIDPTASRLYAGGSDGRVHVASLISPSPDTNAVVVSPFHASGGNASAAVIGVGMTNGGRNLVSCTEDGEVTVWDLASGSLAAAGAYWVGGTVSDVLLVKRFAGGDTVTRTNDGGEGFRFRVHDGEAWRRAGEEVSMERKLHASEADKARSVELIEMAVGAYKRSLRLMLREVTTVATGRRAGGTKGDGNVSD